MKDSVKFFIPPGNSRKIVDPPLSICENFMWPPPPSWNHHHQKFVGFIMMWCRHAKVIALASWRSGGAVRSPGQSLRGGPGIGAHRSSENPGVSSSKNGLWWELRTITLVIVWKIFHGAKEKLMFFFSTSVACIINRTLRKHNANQIKDSVIFSQTNISWSYHSSSGLWDCYQKWCIK